MPSENTDLSAFTTDFHRLQGQKARSGGGVEARVLTNLAFDAGEQGVTYASRTLTMKRPAANKLALVFNLLSQRGRKLVGRLGSIAPAFKARPDRKDAKAFEHAEIVDRLIVALDQKVDQTSRTWEILEWMRVGGVAVEKICWKPRAGRELTPQFSDPTPEFPDGEVLFRDLLASKLQQQDVIVTESQKNAAIQQGAPAGPPQPGQPPPQPRPVESFELYEMIEDIGDVGSVVYGPLQVFVDRSVKDLQQLAPDQAVYIAEVWTHGQIAEEFGDESVQGLDPDTNFSILTSRVTQLGDANLAGCVLEDLVPLLTGNVEQDAPPMNLVIHRWQPSSKKLPHGRYTCFVPDKRILKDGENEYDEIPLVSFHWTPVTTSFFTKDYCTDLIAPQRFLNKRVSQLGEFSNSSAYQPTLLGPTLKASDIPTDEPGVIENGLNDQGQPMVMPAPGKQMPQAHMQSIDLVIKLLNDLSGGGDLFQDQPYSQMRGPQAVPLLQEILDTEWAPLYQHLGERFARVKQMRLNRVKQYYPPARTLHYTDKSQKDEVLEFHADPILRSGTNYTVTVDRGSLLPEFRALRESRVRERLDSSLRILYIDERTGQIDKSKVAADLQFGDAAREGHESQDRKLALELIGRLWKAEPVPPVLPFYHHAAMLDELEAAMTTTEFLEASPQVQQLFQNRWQEHTKFLQEQAQQRAQGEQQQAIQSAVAQATQQAAAQAAAETVKRVFGQLAAQGQQAPQTAQMIQAQAQAEGQQVAQQQAQRPQQPQPPPGRVQ
jgi:hypothetical protein